MIDIKIKKFFKDSKIPTKSTSESAGYDLYSHENVKIGINEVILIDTGISISIPSGFAGFIFSRSGLSFNHGIILVNGVGVIDSDYTGQIKIPLYNVGKETYNISKNDRIAQIVILNTQNINFILTNELDVTDRGDNGFGSSGI